MSQVEWLHSRSGAAAVKVKGKFLCSSIDPEREAAQWLEKNKNSMESFEVVFVLGFGAGYHILEAAKKYPQKRFIAFECLVDVKEVHPLLDIMPANVDVVFSENPEIAINSDQVVEALDSIYSVVESSPSVRNAPEYYHFVKRRLLGRDVRSLSWLAKCRPELKDVSKAVESVSSANQESELLSIITIESALRERRAPLNRDDMVWMTLRELVK
jgi:hypothetical protein